jgi:murein DD-endopeptidase MepM/ murein hydrolase activator NlpD
MPGIVPWLVPVIAAVGAAVVTRVFVGTLVRAVRAHRTGRPPRLLPAFVLFAVLPSARAVHLLRPASVGEPRILSGFGDWLGAEGHGGLDVAGPFGSSVRIGPSIVTSPRSPSHSATKVRRGQPIGAVGTSGMRPWPRYPADRLLLTYPVAC